MWTKRPIRDAVAVALLAIGAAAPFAAAQSDPPPAAAGKPAQSAREFVTKALADITAVLKDRSQPNQARRERIETLVRMWLDGDTISRLALAKHWKSFDEAQQKEFVESFRQHLVLTYYRNVDRYQFARIDVYDDRAESKGDFTVRTKVIAPDAGDVLIDLRLRPTPDGTDWKVIDIFIEGVSLVQNFRSQFQEVLAEGSPAKLLASLRDKNAATLKKYEETEAAEEAGKAKAPGG